MARRPDPAYVLDLGNRLMKARADVKRLQLEWDSLFQAGTIDVARPTTSSAGRPVTNVSRIIEFLDKRVGQSFTADHVHQTLGLDNKQSTKTTLSKLVKAERIRKEGADEYASLESPIRPKDLGLLSLGDDDDKNLAEGHHATVPLSHNRKA
jgi:hypothetical protein